MPQHSRALSTSPGLAAPPLVAALLALVAACDSRPPTGPASGPDPALAAELGAPLPFLTLSQRVLFERGRGVFQTEFTPATGLGPLFNNTACSECHEAPVVGGTGEEFETHQSAFHGGPARGARDRQGGAAPRGHGHGASHDAQLAGVRVARGRAGRGDPGAGRPR